MSITATREQRRQLARDNAKLPLAMVPIPLDDWPLTVAAHERRPCEVWRSREFLCLIFEERFASRRLSVSRTEFGDRGRWKDGISWDELQRVKSECGFGKLWAVEIFPADSDVVNVQNIRHLWILPERPAFAW